MRYQITVDFTFADQSHTDVLELNALDGETARLAAEINVQQVRREAKDITASSIKLIGPDTDKTIMLKSTTLHI